jgi:hypothetical protein
MALVDVHHENLVHYIQYKKQGSLKYTMNYRILRIISNEFPTINLVIAA